MEPLVPVSSLVIAYILVPHYLQERSPQSLIKELPLGDALPLGDTVAAGRRGCRCAVRCPLLGELDDEEAVVSQRKRCSSTTSAA